MSGAVNLLKAAAVWKVVDNGSKAAAGIKRLGEINKESLAANQRQNEITEEIASLTKENILVNRERNQIEHKIVFAKKQCIMNIVLNTLQNVGGK